MKHKTRFFTVLIVALTAMACTENPTHGPVKIEGWEDFGPLAVFPSNHTYLTVTGKTYLENQTTVAEATVHLYTKGERRDSLSTLSDNSGYFSIGPYACSWYLDSYLVQKDVHIMAELMIDSLAYRSEPQPVECRSVIQRKSLVLKKTDG